jgi:hypothetical protein
MNATLDAYRDVVVVNGEQKTLDLSLDLKKKSTEEQRNFFAGTPMTGWFYLYGREGDDTLMECVMSPQGDSITSLYKRHPIFASAGELIRARTTLMAALSDKVGLSIEGIGIEDMARGRTLGLAELSTGQLIDLLAERSGVSLAAKTDSYGQEMPT